MEGMLHPNCGSDGMIALPEVRSALPKVALPLVIRHGCAAYELSRLSDQVVTIMLIEFEMFWPHDKCFSGKTVVEASYQF